MINLPLIDVAGLDARGIFIHLHGLSANPGFIWLVAGDRHDIDLHWFLPQQ